MPGFKKDYKKLTVFFVFQDDHLRPVLGPELTSQRITEVHIEILLLLVKRVVDDGNRTENIVLTFVKPDYAVVVTWTRDVIREWRHGVRLRALGATCVRKPSEEGIIWKVWLEQKKPSENNNDCFLTTVLYFWICASPFIHDNMLGNKLERFILFLFLKNGNWMVTWNETVFYTNCPCTFMAAVVDSSNTPSTNWKRALP